MSILDILLYIALPLGGVGGGLFFFRHQNKLKLRAHLMREAIRNRDFSFTLPLREGWCGYLFYGERALQEALNNLGQDINKLVAQNEVESWQKLTRVLTHEIMNVSTPIQSISQAYLEHPKVVGTTLEKGIHAINEASNNLVTFVESYRKLTQLQEPVVSSLPLLDFVSGIKALYPDVVWNINIPANIVIQTDETLFRQVLVNIVKNAIEAKAKILSFHWINSSLHISNDGTPILPEVRRDIFVPFYTTKPTGTGIGLSLSRQIMTMLGGTLMLADKADSGYHTTFVIDF